MEDNFDEKIKGIELEYLDRLSIEKAERELETKTMLRVMMDAVDTLR